MNKYQVWVIETYYEHRVLIIIASFFFLLFLSIFSYFTIKDYLFKSDVKEHIEKINKPNNVSETVIVNNPNGEVKYKFIYNDKRKTSSIFLITKDNNMEYHYLNGNWYVNIPDYYIDENLPYRYMNIDNKDIEKQLNASKGGIEDYIVWLKGFNKTLFHTIIEEIDSEYIYSNTNGTYKIILNQESDVDYNEILDSTFETLELKDKEKIKQRITKLFSNWLKENEISEVVINIENEKVSITIQYINKDKVKRNIEYRFETNLSNLDIDINNDNILDINKIKKDLDKK